MFNEDARKRSIDEWDAKREKRKETLALLIAPSFESEEILKQMDADISAVQFAKTYLHGVKTTKSRLGYPEMIQALISKGWIDDTHTDFDMRKLFPYEKVHYNYKRDTVVKGLKVENYGRYGVTKDGVRMLVNAYLMGVFEMNKTWDGKLKIKRPFSVNLKGLQ